MESRGTHGNHSQSKTDVGRLYTLSSLIVVGNSYEFLNGSLLFGDGLESLYVYFTFDQRYALRDLHAPEGPLRCVPVCATAQAKHATPTVILHQPKRTPTERNQTNGRACGQHVALKSRVCGSDCRAQESRAGRFLYGRDLSSRPCIARVTAT